MKSIILNHPGQFEMVEIPSPSQPKQNEAQVRVIKVGICGTDLHAFAGNQPFFTYPRILGHELAVEIIAIGDTTREHNLQIGDLCCVRPYFNCGKCGACQRGFENCCVNMQVFGVHQDGGMREIVNIPIDKLHQAVGLSQEEIALVEMLSIGCHAVRRAQIIPGEHALVIGAGPIGLGLAEFAHLAGARVSMMDISETRLAFASRQSSIDHLIDAKQEVFEQLKAIIPEPDDLPTLVFDVTGSAQSMLRSFEYVAHGGRLVFVGLFQGHISFYDPEFHKRELTILASRNATAQDFDQVIEALQSQQADVKPFITHRVSPNDLLRDFPTWLDPANGVIKAMLSF